MRILLWEISFAPPFQAVAECRTSGADGTCNTGLECIEERRILFFWYFLRQLLQPGNLFGGKVHHGVRRRAV